MFVALPMFCVMVKLLKHWFGQYIDIFAIKLVHYKFSQLTVVFWEENTTHVIMSDNSWLLLCSLVNITAQKNSHVWMCSSYSSLRLEGLLALLVVTTPTVHIFKTHARPLLLLLEAFCSSVNTICLRDFIHIKKAYMSKLWRRYTTLTSWLLTVRNWKKLYLFQHLPHCFLLQSHK